MPEAAEVRIIADNLTNFLKVSTLTGITSLNDSFYSKKTHNLHLIGYPLKIINVHTNGKFCWIELETGGTIGIGFGMSGNIRPEPTEEYLSLYNKNRSKNHVPETPVTFLKHAMLRIEYIDISGEKQNIYYHDIRRFGNWRYFGSYSEMEREKLSKLGADILSATVPPETVVRLFRKYNHKNVCQVLMDQRVLSGPGNYIKSEILYECKVDPNCTVNSLSDDKLIELYRAANHIANAAYSSGGASLYTYTGMNGDQSDFKNTLKVYGRSTDPYGRKIEVIPENKSPDGRTTYWVPTAIYPLKKISLKKIQVAPPLPALATPVPTAVPTKKLLLKKVVV